MVRELIDFDEPIGLLLASVFLDPAGNIERLVCALPSGKLRHPQPGHLRLRRRPPDLDAYVRRRQRQVAPCGKATTVGFHDRAGLAVLATGILATSRWKPDAHSAAPEAGSYIHAAPAYKSAQSA
ncbi:hypothetical protein [Streptomyces asiaticus]